LACVDGRKNMNGLWQWPIPQDYGIQSRVTDYWRKVDDNEKVNYEHGNINCSTDWPPRFRKPNEQHNGPTEQYDP